MNATHHSADAAAFHDEDETRRRQTYDEQQRASEIHKAEEAARKALMNDPEYIKKQKAIIAENATRRQQIHQEIDKIVCPDCKKFASLTENPNYKCPKCKLKSQGGSKRKSKSHRRKKSKSQRRKKSIKRRH